MVRNLFSIALCSFARVSRPATAPGYVEQLYDLGLTRLA